MRHFNAIRNAGKRRALLGAIVGDAATMPLHWIYDKTQLSKSIISSDKTKPEFNRIPSCPFYNSNKFPGHYSLGQPSPYGEQLLAMYEIVQMGARDGDTYGFEFYSWLTTSYTGRKDGAGKIFENNYQNGLRYPECGADDNQAMSLHKATIAFSMDVELEPLVKFHQNNILAMDCADFLFLFLKEISTESTTSQKSMRSVFDDLKGKAPQTLQPHLFFLEDHLEKSTLEFLIAWGHNFQYPSFESISCHNPQALLRVLHVCIRAESYVDGIRNNILVGGDNASTSIGIGAVLALYFDDIPNDWIQQIHL